MSHEMPAQPKLPTLLTRYLNDQAHAQSTGLAEPGASAEVTPYEAGAVQPIDAALAWKEAVAAAAYFQPAAAQFSVPPQWPGLVANHEPAVAVAFCLGNFPQLVRNFHVILKETNLAHFSPAAGRPAHVPALVDWARHIHGADPRMLLALGCLRLAKDFKEAEAFIGKHDNSVPGAWRAAWNNEKAAVAWHQGHTDAARALWESMEASVPVLFNRGMAQVFLGDTAKGRAALSGAIAKLPETSAWHHLARLYALLESSHSRPAANP